MSKAKDKTTEKQRRNKGTGAVLERGPNTYRIVYDTRDANGKRKQVFETIHGTQRHAESVLRERLRAVERGEYVGKVKDTVADFMERWLSSYAASAVTARTLAGYQGVVKRYIVPALGRKALQTLRPDDVQRLHADMLARGLSGRTVLQTHRVLSEALSHAVKWGLLIRNVATLVNPPRAERKEVQAWDTPAASRFLAAVAGHRYADFYHFALLTGMRRSEVAGLRWPNVDLPASRVSVVETRLFVAGKGLITGKPKTQRSRRAVSLSPAAVALLRDVRGRQLLNATEYGDAYQDTGYVFTRLDGTPVDPDHVTTEFARIIRRAKLPYIPLHGLRHTHASLLLKQGVHAKIVSERLGHSNIGITLDTYSHVLPGLQEAAAKVFDDVLQQGRGPASS